jgi:hypothetical protein
MVLQGHPPQWLQHLTQGTRMLCKYKPCPLISTLAVIGIVSLYFTFLRQIGNDSVLAGLVDAIEPASTASDNRDERGEAMPESKLRHVVLFQFKESSTADEIESVVQAFRELPKLIPQIDDFEFGTNNSPEGLEDGFTHCFLVTFRSEKDREFYLPHPAHQSFVNVLRPHLEKVLVVDYWTKH